MQQTYICLNYRDKFEKKYVNNYEQLMTTIKLIKKLITEITNNMDLSFI